ncbi:MAG: TadE/TadG family type IV pilus assembly protein, partial [Candidatus Promineifilaceae bacterium]
MKRLNNFFRCTQKGQSLVETALVLPILVILLVGVVEVSNLAITQNKLNTAARAAARFGANGGEDAGILQTYIWAITNTLPLEEAEWDIWVFRGDVNDLRQIPADDFTFEHVYGLGETQKFTDTDTITFTNDLRLKIQDQLLFDVDNNTTGDSSGLKFVGIYSLHDVQTILGLDVLADLVGLETLRGYSVMRRAAVSASVEQTSGCRGVFPVAVEQGVRTVTQNTYENSIFPTFTYPTVANRPAWNEFVRQPPTGTTASLLEGIEGMVYVLDYNAFTSKSFDFLKWN